MRENAWKKYDEAGLKYSNIVKDIKNIFPTARLNVNV